MTAIKVMFIINPVSGAGAGRKIKEAIRDELGKTKNELDCLFAFTEFKGHAKALAKQSADSGFDYVVACGGDGTVNEVSSALMGSRSTLVIFPLGSGNGLARHYHIKADPQQTIAVHVAMLFGKDGRRGFNSYLRLIAKEFIGYPEFNIKISQDAGALTMKAIMIPVAVASQFGNNAIISPSADTHDGKTDITIVRKMHPMQVLPFAFRVFTKNIGGSKFAKAFCQERFEIECETPQPLHIDGEPGGYHTTFKIESIKGAIQLAIP
jgi:diacylglycerol kinase (ATP)